MMATLDEELVRTYFESNGFFVRPLQPLTAGKGRRKVVEMAGLEVANPAPGDITEDPESFQLFSSEIRRLPSALVLVSGWVQTGFTARMLRNGKQFLDYLQKTSLPVIEGFFKGPEAEPGLAGGERPRRILVVPGIPSTDPHREEAVRLFREAGVEHILTIRTILDNLLQQVEGTLVPEQSRLLQSLSLFKIYDMVRAPQLDLFTGERRR